MGFLGPRRLDGLDDIMVLKGPDPGRRGALPPVAGSHHTCPINKAALQTVAKMASLVKTLLAGSLFVYSSGASVLRARSSPVVTVKNGSYEGVHSAEYDQEYFLGMRYSQVRATFATRSYE